MSHPTYALNFCQETFTAADEIMTLAGVEKRGQAILQPYEASLDQVERIYLGSYYCEHLFLALSLSRLRAFEAFCNEHQAKATLVIPLYGESTADALVSQAERILQLLPCVDEVVANDLGTLGHFVRLRKSAQRDFSIMAGRLLYKAPRDPRYENQMQQVHAVEAPCVAPYQQEIQGFEIDPLANTIDFGNVSPEALSCLHLPYCHLTTGRICTAQSRDADQRKRFVPGAHCNQECLQSFTWYNVDCQEDPFSPAPNAAPEDPAYQRQTVVIRKGRMVVFDGSGCYVVNGEPTRLILSPRFTYDGQEG